jgi:hypothetical protein
MRRTATPLFLLLALGALAVTDAMACPGSQQACAAPSTKSAAATPDCCAAPKTTTRSAAQVGRKKAKKSKAAPATRTAAKPAPAPAAPVAAATAGLRAYLDPETGLIGGMPVAVAGDAQVGGGTVAAGQPVEVRLPDGSLMVELQGALDDYLVLTVGPDGTRSFQCAKDPSHVHAAPASAPVPQPEER